MGFRCAPLGIGTDIGGSIRCPAAFCGVYGFRPSSLRNPVTGLKVAASGQETIRGVVGPMASRSIEDLELFQRAVLEQEPWDIETSLVPVPWKVVAPTRDMTVAIMWDDGCVIQICVLYRCANPFLSWVRPHPPITRALRHAKEKLVAAGVKVVDWEPYKHQHGWEVIVSAEYAVGSP
jgi:Asp-tRNA(Asn)/Glu-tRNA(Gln) amidotransferase A subunit family amidase